MEMKHSRTEVRCDFVYDVAARECAIEKLTRRQKVANAAVAEASYQPPEVSVRVVKAAFASVGSASKPRGSLIRLLFDSSSQPALAGTRSAASRIRQLLYRAEPYQIDLQIELQQERNYLVVTGQFLDVSRPQVVGRDVQVTVSNCGASVVNTVTNQFGEFRVEVENSGDLQLSFPGREGKPIVISLRGVVNPSPEE
jgi:hypothetical protein